jgi:hypothetical protein
MSAIALLRIKEPQARTYPSVPLAKTRLNQSKKRFRSPPLDFWGLSSRAERAGLSVRALKAERITEIAMVTANCW